jgi:hypothetical protein
MQRIAYLTAVALMLTVALSVTQARALSARTYVSAQSGSNSNPCTSTEPCRTFAHAIKETEAGGEIDALDPGGYGAVTITKSISIIGTGEAGIISGSGGDGITINAGATDVVNLRGLVIEGAGIGKNGIAFNTGQALTIEKCVIRHHTNNGIQFQPSASSTLAVSDTFVANNTGGNGIAIAPSGSGNVTAVLNRVEADNNGDGILVGGSGSSALFIHVTASDSVAAGNSGAGFAATSSSANAILTVSHSVAANNGVGIQSTNLSLLTIAQSTVAGNTHGWQVLSGTIQSYGDNFIFDNGSNTGSLTKVSTQ